MAGVTVAGTKFPVTITAGHAATIALTVSDDDGLYAWTGRTVDAPILGHSTVTEWSVSTPSAGTLILTLTDTQTTDLGVGAFGMAVSVTTAGAPAPWLAGPLTVLPLGTPGGPTSTMAEVTVQTGASATITITGGVTGPAGGGNIDGGAPDSIYGGTVAIDGGTP